MIYDAIVAGAGPVGLFLACELRLAGLSVLVLEQAQDSISPLKQLPFGLRGLSAPTIEAFYRRGLLDQLAPLQSSNQGSGASVPSGAHWMQQARRAGGHFAGIQFFLDNVDTSRWAHRLPGPAGTSLPVAMQQIETVLAARALSLGIEIRHSVGVVGFEQSDEMVTVHAAGETFRAGWLVGCDGGRSSVRKAAEIEFSGTDPEFTGYSVLVELADIGALKPGRHYTRTGMYTFQQPGTIAMVDFDGGAYHRTQPITHEHVQAVLRRVSGTDVTLTALELAATWADRAYLATDYRKGRVLLAGDAAHTHSPLGGQGLNLGIGDAMNLGWKLAATVHGHAPTGLLDTYAGERRPIAEKVLDWSRAQVALMRPTRSTRALEAIIRDLIDTHDGATYFAERVWGVNLHYDLGGDHALTGRSAPDFEQIDGTRLGELLTTGTGLLMDFKASAPLQSMASGWAERVTYIAADVKDCLGLSALLVRPDGVVAWASEANPDHKEVEHAFGRWFGSKTGSTPAIA